MIHLTFYNHPASGRVADQKIFGTSAPHFAGWELNHALFLGCFDIYEPPPFEWYRWFRLKISLKIFDFLTIPECPMAIGMAHGRMESDRVMAPELHVIGKRVT